MDQSMNRPGLTRRNRRRAAVGRSAAVIIAVTAAVLAAAGVIVDRKTRPVLLAGPMVQIPAPDALAVAWHMDAYFPRGAVRLEGPDGVQVSGVAAPVGDRYEVRFDGLSRGAEYRYTVLNYAFLSREIEVCGPFETRAAPPRGEAFSFLAFGDSGNGSNAQTDLAARMADLRPDLVIHVGDLIYPAGEPKDYVRNFFEPNARLIASAPFMPCLGNHDVATEGGRPLLDAFVLPENGPPGVEPERHYWFDYGDARFVAIDSNLGKTDADAARQRYQSVVAPWAREVLTGCDARWKFAYFHHPYYTSSEHRATEAAHMKEAFAAVFEEGGVDVVFCGHNHLYERTAPIRNDGVADDGSGVVYITTGAGGVSRYESVLPSPDYLAAYNDQLFSFTQVDVSADRLRIRQIDERGGIIDEFTITKPPSRVDAGGGP